MSKVNLRQQTQLNVLRVQRIFINFNQHEVLIFLEKTKPHTVKRAQSSYTIVKDDNDINGKIAYEFEKTTFEILHTSFGAAIWTKIGETI